MRFQFPNDPSKPKIIMHFPGEQYLAAVEDLQESFDDADYAQKAQRFINFKQSKGNYFRDTDGNTVLDMNASQNGLVLGYNHDDMINLRDSELYDRFVTHKVDVGTLPSDDFADLIREEVMPWAPPGMV